MMIIRISNQYLYVKYQLTNISMINNVFICIFNMYIQYVYSICIFNMYIQYVYSYKNCQTSVAPHVVAPPLAAPSVFDP